MRLGQKIGFAVGWIGCFLVWLVDLPLAENAHALAAVMALVLIFWVTEVLPLGITALLGSVLAVWLGVAPASQVFSPYADPVIFLLLGSLLLGEGLLVSGLDERIARFVFAQQGFVSAGYFLAIAALATACLSMGMSNTAACALVMPIVRARVAAHPDKAFQAKAVLTVAYAASLGGIATPIGTPANLIALGFLDRLGEAPRFGTWVRLVGPLFLVLLGAWWGLALRKTSGQLALATALPGPWRLGERFLALIGSLMVLGWLAPSLVTWFVGEEAGRSFSSRLPEASVALAGAVALFVLPATRAPYRPILTSKALGHLDWNTILLFGGGLSLGTLAEQTGLSAWLGDKLLALAGIESALGLIALAAALSLVLTEFMSNTAAVALMLPVVSGMAQSLGVSPTPPVMAATLAASMAFVLPVSTPPNAIAYSTGLVTMGQMVRFGLVLDLLAWAAIVFWAQGVWLKI